MAVTNEGLPQRPKNKKPHYLYNRTSNPSKKFEFVLKLNIKFDVLGIAVNGKLVAKIDSTSNNKLSPKITTAYSKLSPVFLVNGIVGLILILVFTFIVYNQSCITETQSIFYRIGMSIGAGACSIFFIGYIKIFGHWFVATSGFAIFFIVFLLNPPSLTGTVPCSNKGQFKGLFLLDKKPIKDIEVVFPALSFRKHTDENGIIEFSFDKDTTLTSVKAFCKYRDQLDTVILISEFNRRDHEFYFVRKVGIKKN